MTVADQSAAQERASEGGFITRIDGLYVGMLDADEIVTFNDLCARGLMRRDYGHTGGFLGLAKARANTPTPETTISDETGATGRRG